MKNVIKWNKNYIMLKKINLGEFNRKQIGIKIQVF